MKSMTGFGEGVASSEGLEVAATLRSVNHRFLDVSVKLPEELRSLETVLVQQVKTELERGRVEVRLNLARRQPGNVRVTVDRSVADQYVAAASAPCSPRGTSS